MIAQDLIQIDITPLTPKDKVGDALREMEDLGMHHWPIVQETLYEGLISEDAALDADENDTIESLRQRFILSNVEMESHLFDAVRKYGEERISILPVIDGDKKYVGYILPQDVLHAIGGLFSLQAPGSVLVLEVNQYDYSMAQIAQIVESNDAKILATYMHVNQDKGLFEVTIRINFTDLSPIIASFERYEYVVAQAWHENRYEQDLKQRFDQFMNYLNM
ncbi:CBS domain-containing protein [Phaeocystidibacter luteus]|uniref:CBS domain-containing protein n=1 Tax=Phaeocystidibacter luteus TaxID=911197 RepID=A0A6N6RI40_9FLAO|nr:CBS domain-containing protein [Phaeocystidibacter luteus]KAB2813627.1 CBS domain-containing protein [Phaeocystidibacter luteus]